MYSKRVPLDPFTRALRGSYDRSAESYDDRFRPLQHAKYAAMLDAAGTALAAPLRDGRVLDLGCGTGLLVEHLAAGGVLGRLVGLDLSARMLSRAAARGVMVAQGDAAALPFAASSFDAVLAFTVFEPWADAGHTTPMLQEVRRVLARDGTFVVTILGAARDAGFSAGLDAAGFVTNIVAKCGQDVGYVCRRR